MSNSTTLLDTISSSQAQKEVTANAMLDAASPATLFGRRASTSSALTWGYYGGYMQVDGVLTAIDNGTVALTASQTNYVEATRAGVVSKNTTAFTAGQIPLYTVVTGSATVTSYTDVRAWVDPRHMTHKASFAVTTADVTLTAAQARCRVLTTTGVLTGNRSIILPNDGEWIVYNNNTGAYTTTFKTSAGTGVAIAQGSRALVHADGTNVVDATSAVGAFAMGGAISNPSNYAADFGTGTLTAGDLSATGAYTYTGTTASSTQTAKFTKGGSDPNFTLGFRNGAGTTANSEHGVLSFDYGTTKVAGFNFYRGSGANALAIATELNGVEVSRITDSAFTFGAGITSISGGTNPSLNFGTGTLTAGAATFSGALSATGAITAGGYTVATLPAGSIGQIAYVTDQLTAVNAKGVAPTAGGAVVAYQYHNGSAWVGL